MTQPKIESLHAGLPFERVISDLMSHIADQLGKLIACEPHILQNEAKRQYELRLVQWGADCIDHQRSDRHKEPGPEKPAFPDFDPLALLASAFSPSAPARPSTSINDRSATPKPTPSPIEKYLRYQKSLTNQFIRLFHIFDKVQNKPKSGADAHVGEKGSPLTSPILQNKPTSAVDVPSTEHPSAPKTPKLQNEPTPPAPKLQNEPDFQNPLHQPTPFTLQTTASIVQNEPTPRRLPFLLPPQKSIGYRPMEILTSPVLCIPETPQNSPHTPTRSYIPA